MLSFSHMKNDTVVVPVVRRKVWRWFRRVAVTETAWEMAKPVHFEVNSMVITNGHKIEWKNCRKMEIIGTKIYARGSAIFSHTLASPIKVEFGDHFNFPMGGITLTLKP